MSVLEKIRSKTGILVGIVGLALVIFILQSALETGNSFFGSNERAVGKIAGKSIDYNEFYSKVQEFVNNYQQNSGQPVDDQTRAQLVDQVWDKFIRDNTLKVEYEKLGVVVSDDELFDLMINNPHQAIVSQLSDKQTGKVVPQFAKADGTIDPAKLAAFVQQMTPDQEKFWKQMEDYVKELRVSEKYNNLIKKGLYVTKVEAKDAYEVQTTAANVRFVMKRFTSVSDSTIQVSDEELQKYYNENIYKFWNYETTRKIDYVSFDAFPSPEDLEDIKKEMTSLAEEFKSKTTAAEDTAFLIAENENGFVDINLVKKEMLNPGIDSSVFAAADGTVFGPFQENSVLKISKLISKKNMMDSAKVRHILVAHANGGVQGITRTKEQAKKMADSLLAELKKDTKKFNDYVKNFSDDGGKKMPPDKKEGDDYMGKDGNYGWVKESSQFVEPFKNFGLTGKKGDLGVVETNFGYHIMEVLDISKGQTQKFNMATVTRKIEPSSKTLQKYYAQASEFSGKYNTSELFEKGLTEMKLNKRMADNVRENDRQVPGINDSKPLIKWMYYTANLNDVSPVFDFGTRFIVAKLTSVREKGTPKMEEIKEDLLVKAREAKKAEMFEKEFQSKMAGAKTIDEVSSKVAIPIERMDNLNFGAYSIQNVGREDAMCGAVLGLKENTLSKIIKGTNGVFVMVIDSKSNVDPNKDTNKNYVATTQKGALINLTSRVDYEVFEALKKTADIEDHKAKFDF